MKCKEKHNIELEIEKLPDSLFNDNLFDKLFKIRKAINFDPEFEDC